MGGILAEQETLWDPAQVNKRVFPMLFQVLSDFHDCLYIV